MRYAAVAFDLDGTLYPSSRLYLKAWPVVAANARLFAAFAEVRRELRRLAREEGYRDALAKAGGPPSAALRALQAGLTARRLGADPAAVEAALDSVFYRRIDELFAGLRLYRGAAEALAALRRGGLRLALLSDFPPARKLELLGLSGSFETALCSEDTGFLKPAPEPFALLASSLGLAPEKILYVGNSRSYDIAGAKAAGMGAALRGRGGAPSADLRFERWTDLSAFALS